MHVSADLLQLFLSNVIQTNGAHCGCLQSCSMNIRYPNLHPVGSQRTMKFLRAPWSVDAFWGLHPAAIYLNSLFLGLTYFKTAGSYKGFLILLQGLKKLCAVCNKLENGFEGQRQLSNKQNCVIFNINYTAAQPKFSLAIDTRLDLSSFECLCGPKMCVWSNSKSNNLTL